MRLSILMSLVIIKQYCPYSLYYAQKGKRVTNSPHPGLLPASGLRCTFLPRRERASPGATKGLSPAGASLHSYVPEPALALPRTCSYPTPGTHSCASFLAILTIVWGEKYILKTVLVYKWNIRVLKCNLSHWDGESDNDGKLQGLARLWSHWDQPLWKVFHNIY